MNAHLRFERFIYAIATEKRMFKNSHKNQIVFLTCRHFKRILKAFTFLIYYQIAHILALLCHIG